MDRRLERLGAATGLTAVLAVGVPTAFVEVLGDGGLVRSPTLVWWIAYACYLGAFVVDGLAPRRRPAWVGVHGPFAVQLVAGLVVAGWTPHGGFTGVLLVVTAASAAFGYGARTVVAVVVGQTAVLGVVLAVTGSDVATVVVNVALYAAFQAFAVLLTTGQRREAEARAELAATHAELRAATSLLAAATRSDERTRISRDLHDLVGHQLTGLALELEVASHHASGASATHVAQARAIAKDLLRDVREVVGELRRGPGRLDPALRSLVASTPGLAIDLVVEEDGAVDEAVALAVVRVVQEVVTNTLRHAGARHLAVTVRAADGAVTVDTRDDGRGVDEVCPGNGLTGLRERVEQLGGEVALEGRRGSGFTVAARIPRP